MLYTRLLLRPIGIVAYEMESLQQAGASVIRIDELLRTRREVIDGRGVRFSRWRTGRAVRFRLVRIQRD